MDNIQFMHYRKYAGVWNDISSRGGATVAILPQDNGTALISVATCSSEEVFNKKVGRAVSSGRIQAYLNGRTTLEGQVKLISVTDLTNLKEEVAVAVVDYMSRHDLY